MAWGKNQNWKWQLRDRKGRWIEMGRGVKWYSRELGREVSGTVVGQRGKDAIVSLTSEPNDPKTGKPIQKAVKGSDIEVIANKATLGGKPAAAPAAPAGPKAIVNKAEAPAAKKYNDAGLTADEQKAVDFQEKKAKQAADKGDLDAADRYETAAAKTRKIGEDRIKNGEGEAIEDDDTEPLTGPIADRINSKAVRDKVAAIAKDAFENNNGVTDHVDLGDGKILEVTKGSLSGKVGNLQLSVRNKENAGDSSKTTDQLGTQVVPNNTDEAREDALDRLSEYITHAESRGDLNKRPNYRAEKEERERRLKEESDAYRAKKEAEKAETTTKVAPEATKQDASEKTPAMAALIANKDAYPEGTVLRDGSKVSGAPGSRVTKKDNEWLGDGNPPTPADPADFALPTIQRMPPLDANRFEPSDGTGIKDGDIVKGKDGKQYFVHDASDADSIKVRDTDPAASSKNVSALAPNEIASKANLGAVSTPAETPKSTPEKPLLNGEEGYVPVDGRGLKSSKETPKAAPVVPEDALEAAGVQRTEPVTLPGEKFPPTRQQQDIIDSVMAGKDTAVQALAGSGKTSTLEALARRIQAQYPDKKIAYIAFNRSVKLEAEGRMPSNVEAKTQHGLAYGWAPKWMKDRSNDSGSLRRADDVAGFLGIRETIRPKDGGEPMSAKEQALSAMRTVDTFANSAEDRPDASHMPEKVKEMGPEVEAAVLASAAKIWEDLQKPDGQMRFSLDHMRKQWALTKPDLSKAGTGLSRPADIIFMDEAQDTPKVMAALMDHQTAQKVVVGDSNQNIYSSFTGSIDYMSQVQKDIELPLTKSWRFGPAVADIGNRFLQLAEAPHRVEGGGDSKIVEGMQDPDAILVRSNAGMLGEILGELEKGRTVGVPSGTKKDLQSLVDSAAFLKGQGDAPSKMHDDLAAYRSWAEVVAEAEAGDATLAKVANMVNTHGIGGLRNILNQVVEKGGDGLAGMVLKGTTNPNVSHADGKTFGNNNSDYLKQAGFKFGEIPGAEPMKSGKNKGKPRKGWLAHGDEATRRAMFKKAQELASGEAVDVTVSTAHKSKGLEWDKVKIGDDFKGPKLNENTGEVDMPSAEEMRLAYVAATRAAKELDLGSLAYVMDYTDENGGIPKAPDTNEPDNAKDDERPIPATPDDPEAGSDAEEDAPDARPEDDANREEAERANRENEEAPAPEETTPEPEVSPEAPEEAPTAPEEPAETPTPEEPSQAPQDVPEGATETPDGTPVANEETVPEADQQPEPEPEETVTDPEVVPEPQELPKKEAPAPTPAPEAEETPSSQPEEAPSGGTAPPEPDSRPLHPVKAKAANYPDGTIIRDTKTGESIEKTDGKWHVAGYPDTPANPNDVTSPFVYDMPKQADDSFSPFEGIDSVGPGDILVTRKGTQVAVVGKRDGSLVVAPHNQSDEWRKSRPSLAVIPPETVKGVNKFETSAAPKQGGAPATERKRTPFSSNRGNSNVTITDVSGNVIAVGDTVRTDMGTGKIVRVRPSDGPSGSAFVEFPDGTIKSFRSNKMRNTAFAEVAGGDDPSKMDIGTVGEAGDGREFMVGKGNKPIFKGDVVELADGTTGKVSGFAKGVQSVNIRVEGRASDLRKKASVVDVPDYTAPESTSQDTTPEAPASTPEPEAPEPEPTPAVINDPKETPEEREERIAAATSNAKDPAFLSSWWNVVMKDDMNESDIYAIDAEMQGKMETLFNGEMARDEDGILAAKGWGLAAWMATKDSNRSPEEREKMRELQTRITQFVQQQELRMSEDAKEKAAKTGGPVRLSDHSTPDENQSLKSDRALQPEPALRGAELDAYSGIETGAWTGDFFGENSKLNVATGAKDLGNTQTVTNADGNVFREGTKVYSKNGDYVGVVKRVRRALNGSNNSSVTVRVGRNNPYGSDQISYDANRLTTQPTPPVWSTQEDIKFEVGASSFAIERKMREAYPGVTFDFDALSDVPKRMREYAETVSKMLNKYPQLSAVLNSVTATDADRRMGTPFGWASTSNHSGLRDTKVAFNTKVRKKVVGGMQAGNAQGFFNNVPEGREMEYVMTHEFGHVLDYMTGNMTESETYELMKELVPADVMGNKAKLGQWLYANGMVSEYSTKKNKVYAVELVAESFADVELNGASAKPISKLVHAELMKRIDEMTGGSGAIPKGPAV